MGLYCLRALRGLCGFCARVELGGLKGCGVFAPIFIVWQLFSSSLPAFLLCLSSCLVLFVFVSLWLLLFPFPLRYIRKKKGRAVLVRPLLVCRGLV